VACDISQILEQQESWNKCKSYSGYLTGPGWMAQLSQPISSSDGCSTIRKRVHPTYEYSRSDDVTQESLEGLPSEEIDRRPAQLLDLAGYRILPNTMRAYKLTSPPP
jgi:hypothetical protein